MRDRQESQRLSRSERAAPGWRPLLEAMLRIVPGSGPVLLVSGEGNASSGGWAARSHQRAVSFRRPAITIAEVERCVVDGFGAIWSPVAMQIVAKDGGRRSGRVSLAASSPKVLGVSGAWPLASGCVSAVVVLPSAVRGALRDAAARDELLRTLADGGHLLCIGPVGWMLRGGRLNDCDLRLRGRSVWSLSAVERGDAGDGRASTWLQRADTLLAPRCSAFARGQALWLQHTTLRATPLRATAPRQRAGRWASGLAVSRGPCARNPPHQRDER